MANRLLNRQVKLLDYLTSGAAIFGEDDASLHPALQGIDPALLRLEARFSYQKRIDKIVAVFPKTFRLLGDRQAAVLRDFVEACPPSDISRLANARQFHDFLLRQRQPPEPPHLRDVAGCELASATVRARGQPDELTEKTDERRAAPRGIRRHPGLVLLRCAYDIRPIFEENSVEIVPVERDTPLAVAVPDGGGEPRIFELASVVFDLLAVLDDWIDPATFGSAPELDELIRHLSEHGLVEVAR
jgi:hypothetical protein